MKQIKTEQLNLYVDIAGTDIIVFDKTYSLAYYIPFYGIQILHEQKNNEGSQVKELISLEYAYCKGVTTPYVDAIITEVINFLYVPAYAAD